MQPQTKRKLFLGLFIALLAVIFFEVYVPYSFSKVPAVIYVVEKGAGYKAIAKDLEKNKIIKNSLFFRVYALVSENYGKLQAGNYEISSSMSASDIIKKMATGDVVRNTITVIEGWDLQDIGQALETKKIMTAAEFLAAAQAKNSAQDFEFLKDRPKKATLEGYLFPDTYEISPEETADSFIAKMLDNFDKKLTPELRVEVTKQKKTLFQIITMASIIEKEVQSPEDKKIVSGILWKRIKEGVPLQVDATVNYITGKGHAGVTIEDTKIDSPYNTYKYYGLPVGPISNPGIDSIMAAIYPTPSDYWYYLSASASASDKSSAGQAGQTIFSKTLDEHNAAVVKYLK